MSKQRAQQNVNSDDDLNQEINDKLSELWTGMKNKKKQMMRNLTPSYSRRSERTLSELNATGSQAQYIDYSQGSQYINQNPGQYVSTNQSAQNQLLKIKEKLASQNSQRKIKQSQIQKLKNTISQLTNDKKILVKQIHNFSHKNQNSISVCQLNQSSIDGLYTTNVDGKTANFSTNKKKASSDYFNKKEKSQPRIIQESNKQNERINGQAQNRHKDTQPSNNCSLQDLSKARLIQLLKSTSEYRQFAFYYDSHELSYLKRLQIQHKKNCSSNHSKIQQRYWAPSELVQQMKNLNRKNRLDLSEQQVQEVISEMKGYFQTNQELKIKQLQSYYQKKIQKLKRQKNNNIPYDLVRISNAKERQISQISKKRARSIKH